eukprot:Skav215561  [mRNA]  locus=scaffold1793:40612:41583:- [translate_table: standard]
MIEMGAAADPKLLKEAAEAHHKAIGSISGPNGVTSRADWDAVNAALGRVVASVPKAKVMAVFDLVKDITDKVPVYMKFLVAIAWGNPSRSTPTSGIPTEAMSAILPDSHFFSFPLLQGSPEPLRRRTGHRALRRADWLSDIYLKPLPGKTVSAALARLVASVPKSTAMDVCNSMAKVVASTVTNSMFSKVNPLDAMAAAKGFYTFKDVVEASQR